MSRKNNGWAEHGGYMNAKKQKLKDQFENGLIQQISNIFSDVCVFINGLTDPSDNEIRHLMQMHGGKFCHYYNKNVVTHIIATALPLTKINKLKNEKIVNPQWIVDSIETGKLLDWSDYELYGNRHKSNLNMMKIFVKADNHASDVPDTGVISLSEYYSKSRLHHLSTWANQLKVYVQELKSIAIGSSKSDGPIFRGQTEFIKFYDEFPDKKVITFTEPILMHVDMDCFFASVGLRNAPNLAGRPVAVTHSVTGQSPSCSTAGSMSEIASCSYEARRFGIKNGMHLGKAQKLCPDLVVIPYDFDGYLEVAKVLYEIASRYTHDIEVGSCDEFYINLKDILHLGSGYYRDPMIFAAHLRSVIQRETQCTASCGIGSNLLICKLATKKAKPNGQYWLQTRDAIDVVETINVRDLPGIGRVQEQKLNELEIFTGKDLQQTPLDKLKLNFGEKLGQRLFDLCRGRDNRKIQTDRSQKSISSEINYGIRLHTAEDGDALLSKLSAELSSRLVKAHLIGSLIVLKYMVRRQDSSVESVKYLGHGVCNKFSKSIKLSSATSDAQTISRNVVNLYSQCTHDIRDLRGVGIVMQKLIPENQSKPVKNIMNYFQPISNSTTQNNDTGGTSTISDDDNEWTFIRFDDDEEDDNGECSFNEFDNKETVIPRKPINLQSSQPITSGSAGSVTVVESSASYLSRLNKVQDDTNEIAVTNADDLRSDLDSCLETGADETDTETADFLDELGNQSVDLLKEAFTLWIDSEQVPMLEDCELVKNQIAKMAMSNLDTAKDLFLHLKSAIMAKQAGPENENVWNICLESIIDTTQDLCFEHYGTFVPLD